MQVACTQVDRRSFRNDCSFSHRYAKYSAGRRTHDSIRKACPNVVNPQVVDTSVSSAELWFLANQMEFQRVTVFVSYAYQDRAKVAN